MEVIRSGVRHADYRKGCSQSALGEDGPLYLPCIMLSDTSADPCRG